jgi:hypothetical protein
MSRRSTFAVFGCVAALVATAFAADAGAVTLREGVGGPVVPVGTPILLVSEEFQAEGGGFTLGCGSYEMTGTLSSETKSKATISLTGDSFGSCLLNGGSFVNEPTLVSTQDMPWTLTLKKSGKAMLKATGKAVYEGEDTNHGFGCRYEAGSLKGTIELGFFRELKFKGVPLKRAKTNAPECAPLALASFGFAAFTEREFAEIELT